MIVALARRNRGASPGPTGPARCVDRMGEAAAEAVWLPDDERPAGVLARSCRGQGGRRGGRRRRELHGGPGPEAVRFGVGVVLMVAAWGAGLVAREVDEAAVTGAVVDAVDGQPVPGATVLVEGSRLGAATNALGRFEIGTVPTGTVVLVVRSAGFLERRTPGVPVPTAASPVTIMLERSRDVLDGVQAAAGKVPRRLRDVAGQADIVDRSTFEARGDQSVTQAVAHVPGLVVSTRNGVFDSVLLRGLPRTAGEFTNTLLLVDGVPETTAAGDAQVLNLPIMDARRIEVVRGPSAPFYGRTALGGLVSVRTADPSPEHQATLDVTGGEFGLFRGAARASGPFAKWGGYYVSASRARHTGFYTGPFDFAGDQTSVFAKMAVVPDARSAATVSVHRAVSATGVPTSIPIVGGRILSDLDPRFDRFMDLNVAGPNDQRRESRYVARYERELTRAVRLVNVVAHRRMRHRVMDSGETLWPPIDLAENTLLQVALRVPTDEDRIYAESRVEVDPRPGGLKAKVIAGASYENTKGNIGGHVLGGPGGVGGWGWTLDYLNPVHPPRADWRLFPIGRWDYGTGITGLFGHVGVAASRRLRLTAGGRYDRFTLDNTGTSRPGQPFAEDSFDAFSPRVSAIVTLLPEDASAAIDAYALYAGAFVPPHTALSVRPDYLGAELDPEEVGSVEVGVKGSARDGRFSFEGTWFRMQRTGIVTWFGSLLRPRNAGEHLYTGAEGGVNWAPTRRLSLYANAALYRGRFGTFVNDTLSRDFGGPVLTGNRLPVAPERVVNGGAVVEPTRSVTVRLDVKHVGAAMLNRGNNFELPPYTLVDAAVSWRRGPMRITLAAHNLLDAEYLQGGDIRTFSWADPGAPRQVLLTTSLTLR